MGIVDYEYLAKVSERQLMKNKRISQINKTHLKEFLSAYDVSPARRNIFLKQIGKLLETTLDIKKEMTDSKKINSIFEQYRLNLSPAYYSTIVSCALRFVRWLNDEDKPEGFKDIKNVSKSKQKRNLKPSDMITWEDGLELIQNAPSIQLKAIIGTQLSTGLRPSEFIDLKYGDIELKRSYLVAYVTGKTGSRQVIIDKGSPYLSQWLSEHPTKKRNDPLWIMETPKNSHTKRKHFQNKYNYEAIVKRIKTIGERANINKPLDFYNFRHSSAVLMAKWGIPVEIRAKNMGHSIKMHIETYGRLCLDDDLDLFDKANGLNKQEEEHQANNVCKICSTINESGLSHCKKCNSPLSLVVALESERDTKEKLDSLQEQMTKLQDALKVLDLAKAGVLKT